jgi:DNA-directed RNA polymerase specialized sigma24 family protein
MARHYVNNKTLFENMVKYKESLYASKLQNKEKPRIPEYVGECILLICNRLSFKPNFINYTYKEDMIADGIENCIMAVDNFNPEKSDNPFAYFTQIAFNAFLRRIAKEKKQTYIKHKNFENLYSLDEIDSVFNDRHHAVSIVNEFSNEIINSFEEKNTLAKQKKKTLRGLDKLME